MYFREIKILHFVTSIILTIFLVVTSYPAETKEVDVPLRIWDSESLRLKDRERLERLEKQLNSYIRSKQNPLSNASKSLVLPGLGQFVSKNYVKGNLYLLTSFGTLAGSLYFLQKSNNKYEQYKIANNIDDIEKYWNESEKFLLYSEISAGVAAAIWFINVIDAYFTTNNYNKSQFEKFYYSSKKSALSPTFVFRKDSIQMNFVYRF